ncbi:MAG TPA: nuclear transport factor 2 family protein [Gammaproteobacteria bacterium]
MPAARRPALSARLGPVRRTLGTGLLVALLFAVPAAETPLAQPADQAALAAIAEFNRHYLEAINEGDIDLLASLTTEDHMMISSGGEPLVGKEALVGAMTGAFERFDFDETWTPAETVVSGDLAYQRGTFVVVARPRDGGEASRTEGNFLRIYRRQPDGEWRMVRDMFNSD